MKLVLFDSQVKFLSNVDYDAKTKLSVCRPAKHMRQLPCVLPQPMAMQSWAVKSLHLVGSMAILT